MRINRIELFNIGSYEGYNEFDILKQSENGKVVLVGGKNGAGKTTLFNAIKLCLYGYKEAGYQAINIHYKNKIKKLVNDRAKIESKPEAYVRISFSIMNGQDWESYEMKRTWNMNGEPFEIVEITKDGIDFSQDEINDFDNFLLNLIPPELFELYFFDGEEIADFFLNEKNTSKLKESFLTLCGYDTFDILDKYFRKLAKSSNSDDTDYVKAYLKAEDEQYEQGRKVRQLSKSIEETEILIQELEASMLESEERYRAAGGMSIDEWKEIFVEIKSEEVFREEKNAWLKEAANEKLPFIILKKELNNLKKQMQMERDMDANKNLYTVANEILPEVFALDGIREKLDSSLIDNIIQGTMDIIHRTDVSGDRILDLSNAEYTKILGVLENYLNINSDEIIENKQAILSSIEKVKGSREKMNQSSVDGYEAYIKERERSFNKIKEVYKKKTKLIEDQTEAEKELEKINTLFAKATKEWEKGIKSDSISSLTGKAIHFLDKLQNSLYESEKKKVEELFMYKMKQLMRKDHFVDKIVIDDNFLIHVYKRIVIECKGVCENIKALGIDEYEKEYGNIHFEDILKVSECNSLTAFVDKYHNSDEIIDVMLEFDKAIMSKGEKQVFIMSLYWAIMQLCNKEIPFIIDTPFARIDTEHRAHITEFFFKELNGQVFIFSTNEEITKEHVAVIGSDLQAKFIIENTDNKKTIIRENTYFGE